MHSDPCALISVTLILHRIFNSMTMIVRNLTAAILLIASLSSGSQAQSPSVKRPNIIIFLVDDMGWQDTSVPFWESMTTANKRYRTPNMERLAAGGMKFTDAYACAVCTPSRTSMITGVNAAHHHIVNWTSPRKDNNTDNKDDAILPAVWNINGLSDRAGIAGTFHATPLPSLLREAGYHTIHVGKAHWGAAGTPGSNPYNLGFTVNIAGHAAGHPQSYLGEDNYGNPPQKASLQAVPDLQEYHASNTFLTDALTQEALKAIRVPLRMGQPFFLHLSHYAIHTPIMKDKRYTQRYLDMGMDSIEANYASLIEGMDKSLGELMDFLAEQKIDRNTVIIFLSDNGALSASQRGGERHTHNLPLRSGKGSVYEGGIRIPMLVSWPGTARGGTVSRVPVMVDDLFPSILEMAGITRYSAVQPVDGKSWVPVLKNPTASPGERSLVWHYPVKWIPDGGPGINYHSAIRKGDWKLVYDIRNGRTELYNLKNDIGEKRDLSSTEPKKLAELSTELSDRLRLWRSPMPSFKDTGKRMRYPDEATGQRRVP